MNVSEIDKELLKGKARILNDVFNGYLVCYLMLAVCYGANQIFKFAQNEYFFASVLILLCVIMKPIILFLTIQIKSIMKQQWWMLGLVTLFLPFGEFLSANIVVRNVVELLTQEEKTT